MSAQHFMMYATMVYATMNNASPLIAQLSNTKYGSFALNSVTTGSYNSAFGWSALGLNTTGYGNTAVGYYALRANTSTGLNTATGYYSLRLNSSGAANTAMGALSLYYNTTGGHNTAFGAYALYKNSSGADNVATGYNALYNNLTGTKNTASGVNALYSNNGHNNTAHGVDALTLNTSGASNTAVGGASLRNNTTGYYNSACGYGALFGNSSGHSNSALGYQALRLNSTGTFNTALGFGAGPASGALTNTMALGNGASTTASNQVRIGNSSITSIGGYVNWSKLSDGRFKTNVEENIPGLEFINQLRPVSYTVDASLINRALESQSSTKLVNEENNLNKPVKQTGFIAQEVEAAAKNLQYEFSGVDVPKNDQDFYGLRYAEFVVPLVKAIQELSEIAEEQQTEIEELKAIIRRLDNRSLTSEAWIKQNSPNPVRTNTTIQYFIPPSIQSAQIVITNINGQELRKYNISGEGVLHLNAATFASGVYNYTLVTDGKAIKTKKLVITR